MPKVDKIFAGLLMAVILLPMAIQMYLGVDTANWPQTIKMIWDALPVLGVAGVGLGFIKFVKDRR